LATITAGSANRMASVAPRSMPAGLSQITQSNLVRSSCDHATDAVLGQRVLVAGLRRDGRFQNVAATPQIPRSLAIGAPQ
jgi:hypothetical protein